MDREAEEKKMSVNIRLKPANHNSPAEWYHTHSKRHPHHFREWEFRPSVLHEDSVIRHWMQSPFKIYRAAPKRALPPPRRDCTLDFSNAFSKLDPPKGALSPLSIEEVSTLLYYSAGLDQNGTRPYSSTGGLYPLEIYLEKFEGAEDDIFHYQTRHHFLEHIAAEVSREQNLPEETVQNGTLFYITAVFERSSLRYGERGYRYALVEAGRVVQNIFLVCRATGLYALSTGEFLDDRLHNRLNIDGVEEALLFLVSAGRKS